MNAVKRFQIADYLNTGTGSTPTWSLMGVGFNTLDENPNAQLEQKTYVHERNQSSIVKGYQTQFPFDTDLISDDAAVMALYNVGRNQEVGEDAEFDYVRVDLFSTPTSGAYPARKFKVVAEVSSITGEGGGVMKASGNLNAVGDFTEGTFNPTTGVFTAASAGGGGGN